MGQPNEALAALIREAGYSEAGLARRVNDLGALREGIALRYDYSAVYRWTRKGQCPGPPVPALIAEALGERLGRRVRPSEFGLADETGVAARGLTYFRDVGSGVDTVGDLGRIELTGRGWRRRSLVAAPFVLAAGAGPSRDWLLASLDEISTDVGPRRVGMRQVEAIRDMFRVMQEMDVMRGGGHARTALVEYLTGYVMPLTRRSHDHEAVRLAVYEAAAEQAYLVGWMAYDDGQHGLAQRYLIQALRLAEASTNRMLGAHVLAGMSDQANLLGHPQEALSLARAGQRGIGVDGSPACLADLQILEARALAALARSSADRRLAAAVVARAERTFSRVTADNEPEWARFIDPAYFFGEAAHCFRDLGDTTQVEWFGGRSAAEAIRQRRARRGALSEATLAVGDLIRGEPERAAVRALRVVSLAGSVASARCRHAVRDLADRLRPYAQLPAVARFHARVAGDYDQRH